MIVGLMVVSIKDEPVILAPFSVSMRKTTRQVMEVKLTMITFTALGPVDSAGLALVMAL